MVSADDGHLCLSSYATAEGSTWDSLSGNFDEEDYILLLIAAEATFNGSGYILTVLNFFAMVFGLGARRRCVVTLSSESRCTCRAQGKCRMATYLHPLNIRPL